MMGIFNQLRAQLSRFPNLQDWLLKQSILPPSTALCCHQVQSYGSSAHLVKMAEKSQRMRKLQSPPELYVCDLITRLKSATDWRVCE
jgi:hypothetical protein